MPEGMPDRSPDLNEEKGRGGEDDPDEIYIETEGL